MKNLCKHILTFSLFLAVSLTAEAQENQLTSYPLQDALELAGEKDKKVLIDVYAEWCPYCGRMHSDTYTDSRVIDTINDYFVLVKINIESDDKLNYLGQEFTEKQFSAFLQNSSLPTTYFMQSDGELLGKQPGLIPAEMFSLLLEFVGAGIYKEQSFEEFRNSKR